MSVKNNFVVLFAASVLVFVLMGSGAQAAENEAFDSEKIVSEIEEQLKLSQEQWEKLKPVIEEKSAELSKSMGDSVDKGFAELEKLSRQLEMMSSDAESKIKEIVTSEEAQRLRDYLAKVDEEAIEQARDTMIADLNDLLALSAEQAQKIEPVLRETFSELSALVLGLTEEGTRNWNEFKTEFETLTRDLYDRVKSTLDDEQMEKLEQYNEDQKENIERVLFRV